MALGENESDTPTAKHAGEYKQKTMIVSKAGRKMQTEGTQEKLKVSNLKQKSGVATKSTIVQNWIRYKQACTEPD